MDGQSVIVEVTDRGPFVKSRDIDLPKSFMEIAKNKTGVMTVTIEVLKIISTNFQMDCCLSLNCNTDCHLSPLFQASLVS
jgi:rare lipoprotein A (peptidoglycan hydrolase)